MCRDGGPAPTLALWSSSGQLFVWATGFVCRDGGPAPTLVCVASGVQGLCVGTVVLLRPLPMWSSSGQQGLRVGTVVLLDPCSCGVWDTGFACRDGGPTPAVSWFRAQSHQLRLFLIFYKFTHVLLQTFLSHYQMGILSQELVSIYAHFSFLALVGCTFRLQGQLVKGWAPH